ncbi:hypothetical protein MCOR25_010215 [Pyricularia grisea]|uniref:Uncharacterized protein n=1 Tax=Pyricularia grisea TaxID=148305 RepID=A0A6P8BIF3_PYRGI|nr:uncharacterized protein PgNI_00899 [Pyricularia grisea]KAI6351021.1 hypothetical protein MCOR25_010215 [Pyricularia grisea]TLD16490.1 hypothetical protein PgNI_00899 [Pyricularia grisea]
MVSTTIQTTLPTSQQQQPTARPASPLLASPFRRKTMSITQTYYLAHKARAKLSSEAQRPDHNLRKLVGSANLLDALMMELADAEREQESWFNQSVRASTTPKNAERRVQWADTVVEEPEDDWEADDAASDSSDEESEFDDDEDVEMADIVSLTRVSSAVNKTAVSMAAQDSEYFDDDEDDYEHLSLTRSPSHSASPPPLPDLDEDDSDVSEDESMPPSPETAALPAFNEEAKQQQETQSPPTSPTGQGFYSEGYYIPPRNPAGLISAISVY